MTPRISRRRLLEDLTAVIAIQTLGVGCRPRSTAATAKEIWLETRDALKELAAAGQAFRVEEAPSLWDEVFLRPRVLVDVSSIDVATSLGSLRESSPIMVRLDVRGASAHPGGVAGFGSAARAAGNTLVVRESVARQVPTPMGLGDARTWLHVTGPIADSDLAGLRGRVEELRAAALCFEVDDGPTGPGWQAARQVVESIPVPSLIAGIGSVESAIRAAQIGATAVIVSASQFDRDSLLRLVASLGSRGRSGHGPSLVIEGSFYRGSEVMKAVALGAQAVVVTEPAAIGFAAAGPAGLERILTILSDELVRTMGLSGMPSLRTLTPTVLNISPS